jgi:exosortase
MATILLVPSSPEPSSDKAVALRTRAYATTGFLLVALLWSFWTTLSTMAERWSRDPQYSHGFLVPVFALAALWFRRDWLSKATWEPSLLGLPILLTGVVLRLVAIRRDIEPLDAFALLPTLFGLVLFVGGTSVLRWSWPALAFLGFMLPLPFFIEVAMAHPLRRLATALSTYALQTLGYPAIAEGNIILIDQVKLGVVEACSGLGMLTTFFALSTALALVSKAPLLDRILLVVSAVPIALIANVVRITATGMAYHGTGSASAQAIMHDLSGWLMMPFALLLLWGELRFLSKLLVQRQETPSAPLIVHGLSLPDPRPG